MGNAREGTKGHTYISDIYIYTGWGKKSNPLPYFANF